MRIGQNLHRKIRVILSFVYFFKLRTVMLRNIICFLFDHSFIDLNHNSGYPDYYKVRVCVCCNKYQVYIDSNDKWVNARLINCTYLEYFGSCADTFI